MSNENSNNTITITIPRDKIREVIGPKGSIIRSITEKTKTKIDVSNDGVIRITAAEESAREAAVERIKEITSDPEIGSVYEGKVVKVVNFGAFVNFASGRDGLVHISELSSRRVDKVTDVVSEGDNVRVKVIGFDKRGKVKLSMKAVLGF